MGVLERFERRLEEHGHRAFARAFKAEVQPVEIASALQRECDDRAAIVARGRTIVPNDFAVELGQHDYERLGDVASRSARSWPRWSARRRGTGVRFIGPVTVGFALVGELDTGWCSGCAARPSAGATAGGVGHRPCRRAAPAPGCPGSRSAARRTRWPGP